MYDGLINVYKEAGFTSHDVVAKLRGILRQKKIGHTGTLDPDATGVLPVCLGKGTKLCDMLTDRDKEYEATMLLGYETDTQDMSGTILKESAADLDIQTVTETILSFVGPYEQIPPMFSALKVNGQKLCDLARAGKTVERKPRPVEIYRIAIESIEPYEADKLRVVMRVACSKGTYIRTLCHDIGQKLGCGGAMASLIRTVAAGFEIKDALTLSQIEQLVKSETLQTHIVPVEKVFEGYPAVYLSETTQKYLYNGNPFYLKDVAYMEGPSVEHMALPCVLLDGCRVRVYDSEGEFKAIYVYDLQKQLFITEKMFL